MKTHYEVLNITPDAPIEVIHAVYKALNDEYTQCSAQLDEIKKLNDAYLILSNSNKRKIYDESLKNGDALITPEIESKNKDGLNKVKHRNIKKIIGFAIAAVTSVTIGSMFFLTNNDGFIKKSFTELNKEITKISFVESKKAEEIVKNEIQDEKTVKDNDLETQKSAKVESEKRELEDLAIAKQLQKNALIQGIENKEIQTEITKEPEIIKQEDIRKINENEIANSELELQKMLAGKTEKEKAMLEEEEYFLTTIKNKINRNWQRKLKNTDISFKNLRFVVSVTLTIDGKVSYTTIENSSNYDELDELAKKSINDASPFSVPENEDSFYTKFKKLTFVFDHNNVQFF